MRVVVFSGTTEGRAFSKQLGALGADVLVSVATDLGAEEQGSAPGVTVRAGRLEAEEMTALLQGADLCIDATHPYAVEVTEHIRAAAEAAGLPVIFHIHDECVIDCPAFGTPDEMLDHVTHLMTQPIPWAQGLPLNADGWVGTFFKKD
mgnify:CR=1 FL=1